MASKATLYAAYDKVLANGWPGVSQLQHLEQDGTTFLNFRYGSVEVDFSIVEMGVGLPSMADDGQGPWLIRLVSTLVLREPSADLMEYVARRSSQLPFCSLSIVDSEVEGFVAVRLAMYYWDTDRPMIDLQRNFNLFTSMADELDDEVLQRFGGLRYSEAVDGTIKRYEPTRL